MTDHKKNLEQLIQRLGGVHSTWKVFEDFLAISSISVSNAVDKEQWEEREKEYLSIVSRYSKEELNCYVSMFSELVLALEDNADRPKDVLGQVFHDLELHNHYTGQFFTPQYISDFMGDITAMGVGDTIANHGYCSLLEPASGSGTMVLGFAQAMRQQGYNYQKQLLVQAVDIDIRCVQMTYLQLSLYGIPAVVIHGNSLTMEEWSQWKTPIYQMEGWRFRSEFQQLADHEQLVNPAEKRGPEPIVLPTMEEKETGRFTFFQTEEAMEELDETEL